MARSLTDRLARLERRRAAARFDPAAVCRMAGACYTQGLPLPENLGDQERRLALVYIGALRDTEPDRWWRYDLPLPLEPVELGS